MNPGPLLEITDRQTTYQKLPTMMLLFWYRTTFLSTSHEQSKPEASQRNLFTVASSRYEKHQKIHQNVAERVGHE